jgi:hypothetical protein
LELGFCQRLFFLFFFFFSFEKIKLTRIQRLRRPKCIVFCFFIVGLWKIKKKISGKALSSFFSCEKKIETKKKLKLVVSFFLFEILVFFFCDSLRFEKNRKNINFLLLLFFFFFLQNQIITKLKKKVQAFLFKNTFNIPNNFSFFFFLSFLQNI